MPSSHTLQQSTGMRLAQNQPTASSSRATSSSMDYAAQSQRPQQSQLNSQDGQAMLSEGNPNCRPTYTIEETVRIYMNWANYYLLKSSGKTRIQNLESDLCDGVILSQIIESVLNTSVKGICREPKDNTQMLSNVEACLVLLAASGVQVGDILAADICRGNMKSVLSLFFNLSRYKQQQQQQKGTAQSPDGSRTLDQQQNVFGREESNASRFLCSTLKQDGNEKCIDDARKRNGTNSLRRAVTQGKEEGLEAKQGETSATLEVMQGETTTAQAADCSPCTGMTATKQHNPAAVASTTKHNPTAMPVLQGSPCNTGTMQSIAGKMATVSRTPSGSRRGDGMMGSSPNSFGTTAAPSSRIATNQGAHKSTTPFPVSMASAVSQGSSQIPGCSTKERRRQVEKASDSELGTDRSDAEESVRLRCTAKKASSASKLPSHKAPGGSACVSSGIPRCPSLSGDSLSRSRTPSRENLTGKRVLPPTSLSASQQQALASAAAAAQTSRVRDGLGRASQNDTNSESESAQSSKRSAASSGTVKKPVSPHRMIATASSSGGHSTAQQQCQALPATRPSTLTAPLTAHSQPSVKGTSVQRPHPSYATSGSRREPPQGKLYNHMPGLQMYVKGSDGDSPTAGHPSSPPCLQAQQQQQHSSLPAVKEPSSQGVSESLPLQPASPSELQGQKTSQPKPTQVISPVTRCKEDCVRQPEARQLDAAALARNAQGLSKHCSTPSHLQRPQANEGSLDRKDADERSARWAPPASSGSPVFSAAAALATTSGSALRSAGLVAPKVMGTARIATIMSLQSSRDRQPHAAQHAEGSANDSQSSGTQSRVSSTSSSNDSVIFKPASSVPATEPAPFAYGDGWKATAPTSEGAGSSKETTFDLNGRAETRCHDSRNTKETTFDVSTSTQDVKQMQPLNRLASYDFLRKLGGGRTSGGRASMAGSSDCSSAVRDLCTPKPSTQALATTSFGSGAPRSRLGLMHRSFESQSSSAKFLPDCMSDVEDYATAGSMSYAGRLRYDDSSQPYRDLSGYLSEGGASLYALKMQQRFVEGMLSAKECLNKCPKFLVDAPRATEDVENDVDSESDGKSSVSSSDINEALAGLDGTGSDDPDDPGRPVSDGYAVPLLCSTPTIVKEARRLSATGVQQSRAHASELSRTAGMLDSSKQETMAAQTEIISLKGGSSVPNDSRHLLGYMSDSGLSHSPLYTSAPASTLSAAFSTQAEQRLAERQRARKLISPKTQQSLATSRIHATADGCEPYKYATLGRPPTVLRCPVANFAPPRSSPWPVEGGSILKTPYVQNPVAAHADGDQTSSGTWTAARDLPVSHSVERASLLNKCQQQRLPTADAGTRVEPEGRAEPAPSVIQVQIRQARALSVTSSKIVAMQRAAQHKVPQSLPQTPDAARTGGSFYPATASAGHSPTAGSASFCGDAGAGHRSAPFCSDAAAGHRWLRPEPAAAERTSTGSSYMSQNEDDHNIHGSSQSLISSSSSMLSSMADEIQSAEVRRLKKELETARKRVASLTDQLSSNAHIVQAFEHSLSNMTLRLQHVSSSSEQKDAQLAELRSTIEHLCKMSGLAQADLARAADAAAMTAADRRLSKGSTCSSSSVASGGSVPLVCQMSADSTASLSSVTSSVSSNNSQRQQRGEGSDTASVTNCREGLLSEADKGKKKKKNWLRSSFSRAFSKKKAAAASASSDTEHGSQDNLANSEGDSSLPPIPRLSSHVSALPMGDDSGDVSIIDLKRQLREKELKLTDIRLDALTSAHQLEQLREAMNKMKSEMSLLRADNERLQKQMAEQTAWQQQRQQQDGGRDDGFDVLDIPSNYRFLSSPPSRMPVHASPSQDLTDKDVGFGLFAGESSMSDGKRVTVTVAGQSNPQEPGTLIGCLSVGCRTKWDSLESQVKKLFKQYLCRIDPAANLGLSAESILALLVGEVTRTKDGELPELMPYGYLVGSTTNIQIQLKGAQQNAVDALAFETSMPKSILHRYVCLLLEHRRVIVSGPSGTGKSYLARKLAEHLILRSRQGALSVEECITAVNLEQSSSSDHLQQVVGGLYEQHNAQCANSVLTIDNLQHALAVGPFTDMLNGYLDNKLHNWSYIIGTLSQASTVASTLLCQHGFRSVLCASHIEPVKGLLGRYLRRRLVEAEVSESAHNNDLSNVVDWLPDLWHNLNKTLAVHAPGDTGLGVQTLMDCPMELSSSQKWFTDLWNNELAALITTRVRRGLQTYGWQAPWKDPTEWLLQTYPWPKQPGGDDSGFRLTSVTAEDIGLDTNGLPMQGRSQQSLGTHAIAQYLGEGAEDMRTGKCRKPRHDSSGHCGESIKQSIDSTAAVPTNIVDVV